MQYQSIIVGVVALFFASGVMATAGDPISACNGKKANAACEWDDGTPGTGLHSGHCQAFGTALQCQ
ncbi:hypothetical protein PUNSTDRAFT_132005 [Punctularia strigosozonata HHB-11173 SS5]|uniref:uncharacterized protein n=1 Tax=Punctularia strigosozonata (strain HHB-11173) TaxID=741275 RepID=UPI0004417B77|nr:uncharacterized protein PUNSTDRAFT_132005 [Punctularia strigosozonata HHB-11173 SS5]EIN11854.1 hypothetical protein PUNSTDRAFT_132005 [Punctularia strigosozonata HHB-11173 SS5]